MSSTDIVLGGRPRPRRVGRASFALVSLTICGLAAVVTPAVAAGTKTYTAKETIPVPPASSFAGSGGGDGWAVALTPSAVYNVFHHSGALTVACHNQSDSTPCWTPKTITDAGGGQFATSSHPGLTLDQPSGHLFVYVTRRADMTAGVACIDTTQPAANTNPFCGFTPLTAVGEASGSGGPSDGIVAAKRFYAFNYVSGAASTGTRNKLMCFDLGSFGPCASQPFPVGIPAGSVSVNNFPVPAVASILGQLIIPINAGGVESLACFDTATNGNCGGAWPVSLPFSYGFTGAVFPLLDPSGVITGLCVPNGSAPCFSLAGASVSTPNNLGTVIGATDGWNGPGMVIGPHVYVPNGNNNTVACYDYSASASCANFPHSLPNLGYLYTVNPDPQRPECIWVNADNGASQIQNFDAFSGGGCGQGPVRVLASSFVPPVVECTPVSYTKLQVLDPARAAYSSGSVAFRDGSGNAIPGIADEAIDNTGSVSLTGLALNANGLPQFLITLVGLAGPPGSVTVEMTWTGSNVPACGGDTAVATTLTATPAVAHIALTGGKGPGLLGLAVNVYAFNLSATLTTADGPVAGQPIAFSVGSSQICTSTTDANGVASCQALTSALSIVLAGQYSATFAGTPALLASSANAPLTT